MRRRFGWNRIEFARRRRNVIYPTKDGQTNLIVEFAGLKAAATVEVKNATVDRAVSFQLDVMPVFLRNGCNTGELSWSGTRQRRVSFVALWIRSERRLLPADARDPDRRINLAIPERSLLIEKATGKVPHTGGKLFDKDSLYNQTLLRWLQAGAPLDTERATNCCGVGSLSAGGRDRGRGHDSAIRGPCPLQ